MIGAERDEYSRVHNNEIQHTMLSVVTGPLSHSAPREGGEVLERSSARGCSSSDGRVLHSAVLLKCLHELSGSQTLLTNGNIDAIQLLLVLAIVPPLLVKDSVNGDSSLSGLTVTNDKLTLTMASMGLKPVIIGWLTEGIGREEELEGRRSATRRFRWWR
jgi:hypothetical protein